MKGFTSFTGLGLCVVLILSLFAVYAVAVPPNVVTVQTLPATADPCQDPTQSKSSAAINIGDQSTTKIVDAVASKVIYVCGYNATLTGTAPTVIFKSGAWTTSGGDCAATATNLSGTFAPTSGSRIASHTQGVVMKTASGKQLCAGTWGSTASSFQGVLSYIQK